MKPFGDGRASHATWAACLLWCVQPPAMALASAQVPPLLQATIACSASLFAMWLWTRWKSLPVFGLDASLAPGMTLGLLFSLRIALIYIAVATAGPLAMVIGCFGAIVVIRAWWAWPSRSTSRTVGVWMLTAVGLLAGMHGATLVPAAFAAGLIWLAEEQVAKDSRLTACGGESVVFYQLIGAAIVLPVASVVRGENWLGTTAPLTREALAAQAVVGVAVLALRWRAEAVTGQTHRLVRLAQIAPVGSLGFVTLVLGWPGTSLAAACLALTAAARLAA